jgi:hypothetical protein
MNLNILSTTFDDFEVRLGRVEEFMKSHDLKFAPSRMGFYSKEFKSFIVSQRSGGQFITLPELKLVHQALDDLGELELIVDELGSPEVFPVWRERFEAGLTGKSFPEHDQSFTPGRDTQFELYFAAACKRGGLPVRPAEPDLLVSLSGMEIAAALKRVKSAHKFVSRVHAANRQLRKNGKQGLVVVDVSMMLNPTNIGWATSDVETAMKGVERIVDQLFEEHDSKLRNAVYSSSTLGILSIFKVMGFLLPEHQFFTIRYLRMMGVQGVETQVILKDLLALLEKGFNGGR